MIVVEKTRGGRPILPQQAERVAFEGLLRRGLEFPRSWPDDKLPGSTLSIGVDLLLSIYPPMLKTHVLIMGIRSY